MTICLSPPDTDEILRYMGTPPHAADDDLRAVADRCARLLMDAVHPRWVWRLCELSETRDGVLLDTGLLLPGQDIKAHLTGCRRAAVFCATLGAEADSLIRRAQYRDMLHALGLDCAGTAAVEQLCDRIERCLYAQFPGCFFPFRYSPGYGDLPLSVQQPVLELLDAPRKIGLCADAAHTLSPRKSVTAIIGVADTPIPIHRRSCQNCPAQDGCQYRKSGGHCGIL